jgi:hypothetical protein
LSYSDALYALDPRYQSMMRSNPHALYSQLQSPYSSPHLYGATLPGVFSNIPGLHEKMKFEEDYRARVAREEEKAREIREREIREKELREREQREKEQREKEQREKELREREQREKEQREKEMREKEMREREKEMRDREKLMQQQAFMQQQRNPYNLLGLFPQMLHQMRPSIHPAYSPLMTLPIPSTHANSINMSPHPSQSSSSLASSNMNPLMTSLGIAAHHHGIPPPHGMSSESFYHRISNLHAPPPAHLTAHYPYHNNPSSSPHSLIIPATSSPVIRSPSLTTQSNTISKTSSSAPQNSQQQQQQQQQSYNKEKNLQVKSSIDITNGSGKHEVRGEEKSSDVIKIKEDVDKVLITSQSSESEKNKEDVEVDETPSIDVSESKKDVKEISTHKTNENDGKNCYEKKMENSENSTTDKFQDIEMKSPGESSTKIDDPKKENNDG